jgi:hypothetical protein
MTWRSAMRRLLITAHSKETPTGPQTLDFAVIEIYLLILAALSL